MADNAHTVRGIDYKAAFPFVHLFRGFRLAVDPSKLALALAGLVLLYVGGRVLDYVWPEAHRASRNEIHEYSTFTGDFSQYRTRALKQRNEDLKARLRELGKTEEHPTMKILHREIARVKDETIKAENDRFAKVENKKPEDYKSHADTVQRAHIAYSNNIKDAERYRGQGLFIHFLNHEIDCVDAVAASLVALDFPTAWIALRQFFVVAPSWAITQHPVYFTIFFAYLMILMAVCGGAISRIAAVQVARDEKISIRQALRFSTGKVVSFLFAPLIPILIILVIALVLGLLSMFISVPYLGGIWSILVGALFFVALLAGLVMTLTALGLLGGGHLMYPTIAVEGSDSFDAVSRSFSYLYARPWQLFWYSGISLIYGAVTYLFVRFFVWMLLLLTHFAVGMMVWSKAADGTPLLSTLWPAPPSYMHLSYDINFSVINSGHSLGAIFIAFWVYLAIALVGAYAISLYYSSSTIIYYLMRKDVDATAIDEVYLEPGDDEFADAGTSNEIASKESPTSTEPPAQTGESPTV